MFVLYKNSSFQWVKAEAPVDEPECGFDNEHCQRKGPILGE